jgi:hypothetical protein
VGIILLFASSSFHLEEFALGVEREPDRFLVGGRETVVS